MRIPIRGLLLALLALVFVTACSASAAGPGVATLEESQDPGAAASPSPSVSPEDAFLAYAECMREHGVDMPDPQFESREDSGERPAIGIFGAGGDIDKEEFSEADEACRSHLAGVIQERGNVELSPEDEEQLLEFARCMREHGIDFPDPGAGGFVFEAGPGGPGKIDREDDDFQAAHEACADLLPGRGGEDGSVKIGPGGGSGAGPGPKVVP